MSVTIACPACRRRLRLPDGCAGQTVQCPSCGERFAAEDALPAALPAADPLPPPSPAAAPPRSEGRRPPNLDRLRRPAPSGNGRSAALAVFLGVFAVAVVGCAGFLAFAWKPGPPAFTSPPTPAPPGVRNQAALRQDVRDAFAELKPAEQQEAAAELAPLFDGLAAAFRAGDGEAILSHFDVDRMAEEFAALGMAPPSNPNDRRAFINGMRQGLAVSLKKQAPVMQWATSEIRKVKKNGDEAVVIVRHVNANGDPLKIRWWVVRRPDGWKVYDFESLDAGMRLSALAASLRGRNVADLNDIGRSIQALTEANAAAARNDLDGAERQLALVGKVKLPESLEALRLLTVGVVRLRRGQTGKALDALTQAEKLRTDMPILDLMAGTALNRLGKHDEALKRLTAYRDLLGDDAPVCFQRGEALRGLSRFPEAAAEYRKALDLNPKNGDAYLGFLRSLGGEDRKDDVGTRFAKLDDARAKFTLYARDCERRKFPELLEPLAEAMRKIDPQSAPAAYYLAVCKAWAGRPEEAAPLFKAALAGQRDARLRDDYTTGFLQAMASAGKYADAYDAAPDPDAAFHYLAGEALKGYHPDDLRLLTAAHARKRPDDPLLPWVQGKVYVDEERYAPAEKAFAAALAKPPDDETLALLRPARVLARYYTAGALSAYHDIGPRRETFLQLADLLFYADKEAELETLLDAEAKNDPDGVEEPAYRCRLRVKQGRTAEGVALFKTVLEKAPTDEKREQETAQILAEFVGAGKAVDGYRAAPDAKKAFMAAVDEMYEEDRLEDLPGLIAAHREREPADPWLTYYQGEVHIRNEAWDQAAAVLKAGLKTAPKDVRDSMLPRYVFAEYKAGRAMQAYAESDSRDATFTQLAGLLSADKKGVELQALVEAHRPNAGDQAALLFNDALAKALTGRAAEASASLQQACQKQPVEWQRKSYIREVLIVMLDAGQAMEGYRAAPDKAEALDALAAALLARKKDKELAALLVEHGKSHAEDADYRFYRGELCLLRGDAKGAEPHFAAAVAKTLPVENWRYRNGLFRARVKMGEAGRTYQENDPGPTTFQTLAGLCFQEKDAKQLQALIDAHRKVRPDDAEIPMRELEVAWLNHDYEGALKLLSERRDDVFDLPRHRWKANDYRVRCLVRLQRTDEAVREAEALVKGKAGGETLLVLAHAAAGDVKGAVAAAEAMRPKPYLLRSFYRDDDLGPILRGEPFRAWRDKFPEPKEEDRGGDSDE